MFVPSVTWVGSSCAHQNPPMATASNVDGAEVKVCSSLSLLVWKKVLQQFQTGYDVVKLRHGAIVICLSQVVSLGSSWAHQNPPMAPASNVDSAEVKVCSFLSLMVWKKLLQQFQTGYDVVKPCHGSIANCLSQVSLRGAPRPIRTPLWPRLQM